MRTVGDAIEVFFPVLDDERAGRMPDMETRELRGILKPVVGRSMADGNNSPQWCRGRALEDNPPGGGAHRPCAVREGVLTVTELCNAIRAVQG
jgi:hypothetical protein